MKYTTASKYAFAIGALFVAVACSSESKKPSADEDESSNTDDSNTDDGTGNDDGTSGDTTNPGTTDPGTTDPGNQVCTPSCTSDSDCQSTCPSTGGATACCDLSTNTCFNSTEATCPAPASDDAGADGAPPAY